MVKDIGEEPKDDYTNIETLVEHKVIPSRLKDVLVSANSLRNWIIHKYNKLNDTIAYERMVDMFDVLRELVEELINWLSKS
ncbi:MAG: HepT-like ribonuclease domain-containing protein [Candidatus Asgardarchaeia archaeon]